MGLSNLHQVRILTFDKIADFRIFDNLVNLRYLHASVPDQILQKCFLLAADNSQRQPFHL